MKRGRHPLRGPGSAAARRAAAAGASQRLAVLLRLPQLISSTLDPGQVFGSIAEAASRLLEDAAALVLIADERGELTICGSYGMARPELRAQNRFRPGEGLAGLVFESQMPVLLPDMLEDPRTLNRPWIEAEGLHAFAGVPMMARDHCLGVLCAMRRGRRPFRQPDVDLLAAFAAHAVVAIQMARLYQRAEAERKGLRDLLDEMPEAVLVGEGRPGGGEIRLLVANRARAELLRTATPVLGARTPEYELIRPDGTPLEDADLPLQRAIWRGEATRGLELAVRFRDGGLRYILANAVPLPGPATTRQAVVVFQDITDRKQAEEEVRRLAAENVALYERAAREAQDKGLLLDELNHRVRNNLALIVSFLELQKETPAGRRALPVVEDAIARVRGLALVHNVLAGAGVEAGEYAPLVRGLADQTLLQGPLAGRVTFQADGDPLRLPSQQLTALGLITNELFTNIAKYAFPGGRCGRVHVSVEAAGPELAIRVRDDGVGLPAGFTEQPGHLGLQLIHSLVEVSLKGTFRLESGGGTTAVIRFPRPG